MPSYPDISKGEGLIRTYDLLENLIADVYRAFEILESDKSSQYLRRCVARSVFAFIEGVIQIVKWEVQSEISLNHLSGKISDKEREFLDEEKDVSGRRILIRIPVDENIKKTFRLAAKIWNLGDFILATDGLDYQDFLKAKDARNRLTHPRTYYDLEVTDLDMHCYSVAFSWAQSSFLNLFQLRADSLSADVPDITKKSGYKKKPKDTP